MNFPEQLIVHTFKEHPVKNYLADDFNEFDIIGKPIGVIDFLVRGKFSDLSYCKAVISKLSEISKSQINEFLEYQLGLMDDKKRWLIDLEKFIELNAWTLGKIRPTLKHEIDSVIELMLNTYKVVSSQPHRLIWKADDVDLLELIIALTESKAITNKEGNSVRSDVIRVFEEVFGMTIKDANKKIGAAVNRKRDNAPFLKAMLAAYEEYARRAKNK